MRITEYAIVTFGLVRVDVGITPASSRQSESFTNLHCGVPIKQDRRCQVCGATPLELGDLTKGVRVAKDTYISFTADELATLERQRSTTIELKAFVRADEVVSLVEKSHWLIPSGQITKNYDALRRALANTELVGVGTHCLHGTEHLCAVKADESYSALKLLQLTPPQALIKPVFESPERASDDEVMMAEQLLWQKADGPLDDLRGLAPSRASELQAMIDAKLAGLGYEPRALPQAPPPTVDLMDALRQSMSTKKVPRKKVKA